VTAAHAIEAEARLYDYLFTRPDPDAAEDFTSTVNPNSLEVLAGCKLEPSLASAKVGDKFQFERQGYFCVDPDSTDSKLIFNRSVGLKDTWAKIEKKG
jgi:glutaminyl-tRNA synthetase